MALQLEERHCCGCSACASICPKNAINMQPDEKGFLVPSVKDSCCVDCRLCEKVCPILNQSRENHKEQMTTYVGMHKDENIRKDSRSGGIFMAVAEWIIEQKGSVYGAAFTKDLVVQHKRADTFEDCRMFQGSKYVQSDPVDSFSKTASDLKQGKYVLYSGTGCQIDGLLHYLYGKRIETKKLITCDIVCHGNVSPKMYEDYRKWYEDKYHGKMVGFNFRDKSKGWASHFESFVINGKKYIKRGYTELYYCKAAYRAVCYECPYADTKRVGDLTLADCWGAEEKLPEMYDNKGISLVLINSEKGNKIFQQISGKLNMLNVNLKDFMQPQLKHPIEKSEKYQEFWRMYQKKGFKHILKTFGKQNSIDSLKRWIRGNILKS